MTKQEVIKKAYGEHLEDVKNFIDENGWVDFDYLPDTSLLIEFDRKRCSEPENDFKTILMRPKSLQGIETNNDWTSISSEEDLPKNVEDFFYGYHDVYSKNSKRYILMQGVELFDKFTRDLITHYQPIQKPEPPIY